MPPPDVKSGGSGFGNVGMILAAVAVLGCGGCALVAVIATGSLFFFSTADDDGEASSGPSAKEEEVVEAEVPSLSCEGGRAHTRCLMEAGERYKDGELEEALMRTYAAPQPFFPERDAMAVMAKAKPSWGTRARFGCDPEPAPCDLWAFWQADRGGPEAVEGIEALEHRCKEDKVADACHRLGLVVEDREEKPKLALTYYKMAWEGGDQAAGTAYGYMLAQSDLNQGMGVLRDACGKGVLRACWAQGLVERHQMDDVAAAKASYTKACKEGRGDLGGCAGLGDVLYYDERSFDTARSWYQLACERANHGACLGLADGLDRVSDKWKEARAILDRACREGSGEACWRMVQRAKERGKPLSSSKKRRALERACSYGHNPSCETK